MSDFATRTRISLVSFAPLFKLEDTRDFVAGPENGAVGGMP